MLAKCWPSARRKVATKKTDKGVGMDFQKAYMNGQKSYLAGNRRCPVKGTAARYWQNGYNFRKNCELSKQGKFRGRFSEPQEKGALE